MTVDVTLKVNGLEFTGWETVEVEHSIEAVAGSFRLSVGDRWGQMEQPWPIAPGDTCTLILGGETVITGKVDSRQVAFGTGGHTFSISGRDTTANLVDCSVRIPNGWLIDRVRIDTIVRKILGQFGIPAVFRSAGSLPTLQDYFAVSYGETGLEVLDKATRLAGVLMIPDTKGGLIIGQPPFGKAANAIEEGANIKSIELSEDMSKRFRTYYAAKQMRTSGPIDESAIFGEESAIDNNVPDAKRVLLIHGETTATIAQLKQRAAWEAAIRAARSQYVDVVLQGWAQDGAGGKLWPLGGSVQVKSPTLGVDATLIIAERRLTFSASSGTETHLKLARADAYLPEPLVPQHQDPWAAPAGF
jgi:prophage tail gpP-like protein